MSTMDPQPALDPTFIWVRDECQAIDQWRVAAIEICRQHTKSGLPGVEAWLTKMDEAVFQRTGNRFETVCRNWRHTATERFLRAQPQAHPEAAAQELVFYIEELTQIYRRQLGAK